jgi:acyl carrier protein
MDPLELEIKRLIIDALHLEDIGPEDIESEAELFGDGLGLDSIDALELGIALQKKYGIKLEEGNPDNRKHFRCVATLAQLVRSHQRKAA